MSFMPGPLHLSHATYLTTRSSTYPYRMPCLLSQFVHSSQVRRWRFFFVGFGSVNSAKFAATRFPPLGGDDASPTTSATDAAAIATGVGVLSRGAEGRGSPSPTGADVAAAAASLISHPGPTNRETE